MFRYNHNRFDRGYYDVECPRKDCGARVGEKCKNRPAFAHQMRYKAYWKVKGDDEELIKLKTRFLRQEETYPNG